MRRSPALESLARQGTERYRVAVILEPVYRASGDLTKLVGALDAELESVDDRTERVRILREMAEIHQRLGRPEAAFDCRSRAWLTDVDSVETLSEMEALGTAGGMHAELVVSLQKGAVEAGDPQLQAQLWAMAARLLEDPLGRAADAVEAWRSALAARPDEPEIFLALERLLSGAARSSELVEVLEKHVEITSDATERKAIAKRIAVLYEDALKQRESAVRAWEAVLDIDPSDSDALDSLAQLHLAAGSYRDLADVFTRKIELSTRPEERRMLLAQSAHLYEQQLSEPEQAIDQLRRLLEETPGDAEALADLDRIFSSEGRHSDLIEVLDTRAARETSPAARDELAFRAARLMETELSDVEGAIGRYHHILAASPDHAGARDALATIARGDDYRVQAISVLEPILRAARAWGEVIDLLELRLAVEDAVEQRLAILGEIARIEELERRDVDRAFAAWARALTEEATEAAPRQALERLAGATNNWQRLAEVYEERMDATFDASLQRSLALRLASLYEQELADHARAAEFLRKALALPGDEEPVLASLEQILRQQGEHAELADVLARQAEVVAEPARQAEFLTALGDVRRTALEDAEGALAAYRDALDRNADNDSARVALRDAARPQRHARRRAGRAGAAGAGARRLRRADARFTRSGWSCTTTGPSARTGCARSPRSRPIRSGSPERAIAALGRALVEEPMPGAALDDIERIAGASKLPAAGAAKIEAVLDSADAEAGRELALRAARLYTEAGDRAAAERLYVRVLDGDDENVDALMALEGLYRVGGRRRCDLAAILERRASAELDPQTRRARLMEAAAPPRAQGRGRNRRRDRGAAEAARGRRRRRRGARTARAPARGDGPGARAGDGAGGAGAADRRRPVARAALWSRVGELRLGMLQDLDGAAEAYREALDTAPDDPLALSRAGIDRGAPRGLVDAAGGADAPAGRDLRPRPDRGPAQAGAQRRAEAVRRRSGDRLPAPDHRRRFAQRLRLPGAGAHPARERALVRPGRGAGQTRRHGRRVGAQADGAGAARGDRRRLGEGARLRRERRRGAGEGAGGRPDERRRAAVARAAARGGRALGRGGRGARARGGERRRPRRDRRDPVPQRADPDPEGSRPGGDRARAAAGARRRPDAPPDAGGAGEDRARGEGRRALGAAPGAAGWK